MTNKKVLIITYYWPPSGGSGVQRWLKMSKYLNEFGWDPVIYTADGGETPATDESLLKDIPESTVVLKQPIWEPYGFYKKFTGRKKSEKMGAGFLDEKKKKSGITEKLAVWIRGNMFIPDARKYWIKPSIKYLNDYIQKNQIDAIISTGPPHSMHLIAQKVSEKNTIRWIADFRDPWTEIDFYHQLKLSNWADKKHKHLERKVLQTANKVVTVSDQWAKDLERLGANKVDVITNGFDPADVKTNSVSLDKVFSITHIGSMNKDRNPNVLWESLGELVKENPSLSEHLKLRFIGKTDYSVFDSIQSAGLEKFVESIVYMSHDKVMTEMAKSQILLLAINDAPNVQGIIPGKIFEYLAVKRPILAIGPKEAASGEIMIETNAGNIVGFKEKDKMKETILDLFDKFQNGNLNITSNSIEKYSRKNLAENYSELLNQL